MILPVMTLLLISLFSLPSLGMGSQSCSSSHSETLLSLTETLSSLLKTVVHTAREKRLSDDDAQAILAVIAQVDTALEAESHLTRLFELNTDPDIDRQYSLSDTGSLKEHLALQEREIRQYPKKEHDREQPSEDLVEQNKSTTKRRVRKKRPHKTVTASDPVPLIDFV